MTLPPGCAHPHGREAGSVKLPIVDGISISPGAQPCLWLSLIHIELIGLGFLANFIGPSGETANQQEFSSDKMDVGTIFCLGV